jgi:hypothetical protein
MNMTTVPSNQLKAMQHQLAAQELVIQQLRDALIHHQKLTRPIDRSYEALAIPASTKHLEAWYKGQVGDAVAWVRYDDNGYLTGLFEQYSEGRQPLHAIKPFKGE